MVIRFFLWATKFPKTILFLTLIVTLLALVSAKSGLFPQGKLNIDISGKPYLKKGQGSAYDYYEEIKDAFREKDDSKKKKGTTITILYKPQNLAFDQLDLYLKIDEITKWIQTNVHGVVEVDSLLNAKRYTSPCMGKTILDLPAIGNVCESLLDTYNHQLECVRNKDKYLQQNQQNGNEEDLNFDESEEEEDENFYQSFVCSPDILAKTEKEVEDDIQAQFSGVLEDIKKLKMLHQTIISSDFKSSIIRVHFEEGINAKKHNILPKLEESMDLLRAADMEVAWKSGDRNDLTITNVVNHDLSTILPATLFIMLASLFISFRNVFGMLLPFIVVTIAVTWTAGVVSLFKIPLNTVTMSLPALLICVGNDYAIHLLNSYFIMARKNPEKKKKEIINELVKHLTVPLTVTALTTVGGFTALGISDIPAIRQMGFFASVGVTLSILLTLTFLPAILLVLPLPKANNQEVTSKETLMDKFLAGLVLYVDKYPRKIMWMWAGIFIIALIGIGMVKADGDLGTLPRDSQAMKDRHFFGENFIGDEFLVIILTGKESPQQLKTAKTVSGIQKLADWALQRNGVTDVSKIDNLRVDQVDSLADYIELNRNGLDNLQDKEVVTYFDRTAERYGFPTFLSRDDSKFMVIIRYKADTIPARLEFSRLVEGKLPQFLPHLDARYTGNALISGEAEDNIAKGQIKSVTIAFVFIFVILSILFLSVKMGALAVLPNVIPIAIFFGTLGFLDISIGVTVSLVAAIALGIGVDDTIHYLLHYNENLKEMRDEKKAALYTIHQTGRPMTLTTVSVGLGFIIFLMSDMFQQRIFGALTAYIFVVCLITDLNFLPAVMSKVKLITVWDYIGLKLDGALLKTIRLFEKMTLREAKLATLMSYMVELKEGEALFKENEIGHELFIVLEGGMDYYLDAEFHSEHKLLAQFKAGDTLGEMGLFGDTKRIATACANQDTRLIALNLEYLLTKVLGRYPKIATKLFVNLARTLALAVARAGKEISERKTQALIAATDDPERYLEELKKLVDQIIADGVMSMEERKALDRLIYADGIVSPEEQEQLDRLNKMLEEGTLEEEKSLKVLMDEILEDGVVTVEEWGMLNDVIYADHYVNEEEQAQLDRLNQLIKEGKVIAQDPVYEGIFQNLSSRQIDWMKKHYEIKSLPSGVRVFSQGDYGDYMLVVLKGKFNIEMESYGQRTPIATIFEGDTIGGFALLCGDHTRSASVVVLEDAEVMFISEQGLQTMVQRNVKLAARFYHNLICMFSDQLGQNMKKLYLEKA